MKKKGRQQYCCNLAWMKNGGLVLWSGATVICEMSKTSWQIVEHLTNGDLENHLLKAPSFRLAQWWNIILFLRKTSPRLHPFGKTVWPEIFLGYVPACVTVEKYSFAWKISNILTALARHRDLDHREIDGAVHWSPLFPKLRRDFEREGGWVIHKSAHPFIHSRFRQRPIEERERLEQQWKRWGWISWSQPSSSSSTWWTPQEWQEWQE